MIQFIIVTVLVALTATFGLLLIDKWGMTQWVQVHGRPFFSNMFRCRFCLSFWAGVILSILFALCTGDAWLLLVPVCSAPLTRILI